MLGEQRDRLTLFDRERHLIRCQVQEEQNVMRSGRLPERLEPPEPTADLVPTGED